MSLGLRVALLLSIILVGGAIVGYILYMTLYLPNLMVDDVTCGLRGPYYLENEANLSDNNSLLINQTRPAIKDEYPFHVAIVLTFNESSRQPSPSAIDSNEFQPPTHVTDICNGVLINSHQKDEDENNGENDGNENNGNNSVSFPSPSKSSSSSSSSSSSYSWILTSASCFKHRPELLLNESFIVTSIVASNNLTNETSIKIDKVIIHPEFSINETTYQPINDVALVKVNSSLTSDAGKFTCPICLPSSESSAVENNGSYLSTWFVDDEKQHNSTLVTSEVKISNHSACQLFVNSSLICTNEPKPPDNLQTKRNFGGVPLVTSVDNRYVVVGISSFGVKMAESESELIIYTQIEHFKKWIEETVNEARNSK